MLLRMLRKFADWFIFFGLSFLVQNLGWTDQGTAFMYIHLGVMIVFLTGCFFAHLFSEDESCEKLGFSVIFALMSVGELGLTLAATWGATQLFGVEFTVAYQIMTFGQCLCDDSSEESNE